MEGKIRALPMDLRATKDNLCWVINEIKTWRSKEDFAKNPGVGSVKRRKSHKNTAKRDSKAAVSWAAGTFPIITLGLASVVALLLMSLSLTSLHANDTHMQNWLSIFVAFNESVIVGCGRPSKRMGEVGPLPAPLLCGAGR